MTQLLLVVWASLVFVELNRSMMARVEATRNLHCFQCDMVIWANQCQPIECKPKEKMCMSKEVLTSYTGPHSRPVITKGCVITCPKLDNIFKLSLSRLETRINTTCCSWNNCNRAPKSWEGLRALLGRVLLSMGLGLFCTLLG